jgi:hypothetical protein
MKWFLFALMLLTMPAYGRSQKFVDPALKAYFSEFISDALAAGVPMDVERFVDLKSIVFAKITTNGVLGYCISAEYLDLGGFHRELNIEIDPEMFASLSKCDRRALIYHELGHCLLGLDHSPYKDSLMFWYIQPDKSASCNRTKERIHVMFMDARYRN